MAVLTFKGKKDPIEINNKDAERIKNLWTNYMRDRVNQPVQIGMLTTSLYEIKSVELEHEGRKDDDKVYSLSELLEYDKRFDKYRDPNKKNPNGTNYLSGKAERQYLIDQKILKDENTIYESRIGDFDEHERKMFQLNMHKVKEERSLEQLDEMKE